MDMTRGKDQRSCTIKSEVGFCSEEIWVPMRYAKFSQHQTGPHTSELTRAGAINFKSQKALSPSPAFSRIPARSLQLPL